MGVDGILRGFERGGIETSFKIKKKSQNETQTFRHLTKHSKKVKRERHIRLPEGYR